MLRDKLGVLALLVAACGGRTPLRVDVGLEPPAGEGGAGGRPGDGGAAGSGGRGGGCADAVLGTDGEGAIALALTPDSAIWTSGDGRILRAPLASGPATTVLALDAVGTSIAVEGGWIYWTDATRLLRVPLGGGATETVAEGLASPFALAVRGGEAWWLEYGAGIFSGALVHRRVDGVVESLVTGLDVPKAMRIDDTHAWFLAGALAIPDSSLFGVLARVPLRGTELEIFLVGLHEPVSLALGKERAYWLEQQGASLELAGTLSSIDKTGAQASVIGAVPDRLALGLAVDDVDAYLTSIGGMPSEGALTRLALGGGAPTTLASLDGVLYGEVALTEDSVVWNANWIAGSVPAGTPSVRRICK